MFLRKLILTALMLPLAMSFSLRSMRTPHARGLRMNSTTAAADVAKSAIDSNKVMVFSKTYCPYCTKAKSALAELNIEFGLYELDNMKDGADIQAALATMTGQRTVPNVFIKGKHLGGCDSTLAAIADGSLKKLLA